MPDGFDVFRWRSCRWKGGAARGGSKVPRDLPGRRDVLYDFWMEKILRHSDILCTQIHNTISRIESRTNEKINHYSRSSFFLVTMNNDVTQHMTFKQQRQADEQANSGTGTGIGNMSCDVDAMTSP
jgi:hypothetical protein